MDLTQLQEDYELRFAELKREIRHLAWLLEGRENGGEGLSGAQMQVLQAVRTSTCNFGASTDVLSKAFVSDAGTVCGVLMVQGYANSGGANIKFNVKVNDTLVPPYYHTAFSGDFNEMFVFNASVPAGTNQVLLNVERTGNTAYSYANGVKMIIFAPGQGL